MKNIYILLLTFLICFLCGCQSDRVAMPTESEAFEDVFTLSSDPVIEETSADDAVTANSVVAMEEKISEILSGRYSVYVDDKNFTSLLTDEDHLTSCNIYGGQTLSVKSDAPFCSLYIVWSALPGIYEINWEGGSIICGQDGFLHEYVQLPEAVSGVTFSFSDVAGKSVCDILLLSEGAVPDHIQVWQTPSDSADILVFPTHSDDDVLFFGALISHYAIECQMDVQCAFMVTHKMHPERAHERLNGLWEMGVRRYPVVGYHPDSSISNTNDAFYFYSAYQIQEWQTEQIRRFRPLVAVGHDLKGEYGNGGHKVNAYFLTEAVVTAADPEAYPESAEKYGVWDTPKLYLHLYPENRIILNVNTPLIHDEEGRTAFQIAQDAYAYHVSQHHLPYQVRQGAEWEVYDCTVFGLYRSLVGEDSGDDIMENIREEDWR